MKSFFTIFLFSIFIFCTLPSSASTISIIVNKSNPINKMSKKELADYWLKKRTQWAGGKSVVVFGKIMGDPAKEIFLKDYLHLTISQFEEYWITRKQQDGVARPQEIPSDRLTINLVGRLENAISYVLASSISAQDLKKIKIIEIFEN